MKTKIYVIASIELLLSPKSTKKLTTRNEIIRAREIQELIEPNQTVVIHTAFHQSSWVLRGTIHVKAPGGGVRFIIDNGVRIVQLIIEGSNLTIENNDGFRYLDDVREVIIRNGQSTAVTIVTNH